MNKLGRMTLEFNCLEYDDKHFIHGKIIAYVESACCLLDAEKRPLHSTIDGMIIRANTECSEAVFKAVNNIMSGCYPNLYTIIFKPLAEEETN